MAANNNLIQDFGGIDVNDPIIGGPVSIDDPIIQNRPLVNDAPAASPAPVVTNESVAPEPETVRDDLIWEESIAPTPDQSSSTDDSARSQEIDEIVVDQKVVAALDPLASSPETTVAADATPATTPTSAPTKKFSWPRIKFPQVSSKKSPQKQPPEKVKKVKTPSKLDLNWKPLVMLGGGLLAISTIATLIYIGWRDSHPKVVIRDDFAPYATDSHTSTGTTVATTAACQISVEPEIQATVESFAAMVEGEGYEAVAITSDLQNQFDFFQTYALGTNAHHCFFLEYCENIFASNHPFALAFARRSYLAAHYGSDDAGRDHAGEWVSASYLTSSASELFGLNDLTMDEYPIDPAQLTTLYNAENNSFRVDTPREITGPYHYRLSSIRENPVTHQRIFIADTVLDDGCTITINADTCSCPAARYYLVQDIDPATDQLIYTREYVQLLSPSEQL